MVSDIGKGEMNSQSVVVGNLSHKKKVLSRATKGKVTPDQKNKERK